MNDITRRAYEMRKKEGLWKLLRQITRIGRFRLRRSFAHRESNIYLIRIDPTEIKKCTPRPLVNRKKWNDLGLVVSGSWDQWSSPDFSENILYQSMQQHFINDTSWDETTLYKTVLNEIDNFGHSYSYEGGYVDSESNLLSRCNSIEHLFESIRTDGYKSQLRQGAPEIDSIHPGESVPMINEIMIDISRSGEPLFVDGKHRLSIAKILNLDSIPALVMVQHANSPDLKFEITSKIHLEI